MATNLRKYKYTGSTATRPNAASDQSTSKAEASAPPSPNSSEADMLALKNDILASLKSDISEVFKTELKAALADDFDFIKGGLEAVRAEVANCTAALRADLDQVKLNVKDIEDGLSSWSDEVVALRGTVTDLKDEVNGLKKKCEEMEGRIRRCNVRIFGVPEAPESSSTTAVSKLLTEVLQLDKEPLIDRSHRTPGRKMSEKPRVIVAKLHYYQDCVEILRRARNRGPLRLKDTPISITPDYTASVAKARSAFTEVRKLLRNRQDVRYGLLFPARLRITYGEEDKTFLDPNKAMAYVKKNVISAPDSENGE